MKKVVLLSTVVLSMGMLAACSNDNSGSTSTSASSSSKKVERHYKYYSEGQAFYSDKGSLTINKLIGYTVDGKEYFIMDVTYKNTSKKPQDSTDIMSPNIEAFQFNKDKSQKVSLNGGNSISDYYYKDDNATDNQNRLNEITGSSANKLMPGKELHTIMDYSYSLNNTENDIDFDLNDPNAISDDTVNPKQNKVTIKASTIKFDTLNLNDYSTN